jgi:hypothetical protein
MVQIKESAFQLLFFPSIEISWSSDAAKHPMPSWQIPRFHECNQQLPIAASARKKAN